MAWSNVAKPNTSNYTSVNVAGKAQYDDPSISYDDVNVYYDAIVVNAWTNIVKPTGGDLWSASVFPWLFATPWRYPWAFISKPV